MDSLRNQIESFENLYNLDLSDYIAELGERINDYNGYIESQSDSYIEDEIDRIGDKELDEGDIIEEIFKSLAEK
jgi:hypothetical protein